MQKSPLVSIIIPSYNNRELVCQAIDCSLNQDYENLEIIVVDDGSTDDTERILKKKYGNEILYFYQKNNGAGSARNTGIKNSSGKYLQFLDADDLLAPDKISIQIRQLNNVRTRALSYCDYVWCDLDDITQTYKCNRPVLDNENPFDDIMMKWETEVSIPIHCFLFDAVLFKEKGIFFDEKLPANEDWDCWMNIFALQPTVVFVNKVLAYYRIREGSRCSDREKMRKAWIDSINKQIEKHKNDKKLLHKLILRKREILWAYRDSGPVGKILQKCPPSFKRFYEQTIPWRIQRIFF